MEEKGILNHPLTYTVTGNLTEFPLRLTLRVPLPQEQYTFTKAYNISSAENEAILIGVQAKDIFNELSWAETEPVRIPDIAAIEPVKGTPDVTLKKGALLVVIYHNDTLTDTEQSTFKQYVDRIFMKINSGTGPYNAVYPDLLRENKDIGILIPRRVGMTIVKPAING